MLRVHQDIILSNLSVLVEETNLQTLVPELLRRNVFNKRMISRILNPSHNIKRQKTDLYVEILKRGPEAFTKLLDALISANHLNLAAILKGMDANNTSEICRSSSLNSVSSSRSLYSSDNGNQSDGPCQSVHRKISGQTRVIKKPDSFPSSFPANSGHSNLQFQEYSKNVVFKTSDHNDLQNSNFRNAKDKVFQSPAYRIELLDENLRMCGALTPEDKILYTSEKNLPVYVKSAEEWQTQAIGKPRIYKMDTNPRGFALLVNNMKFQDSEEYPDRLGSENDETRLTQLLTQLHFIVESYQNKTKREMEEIVEKFSQKTDLNDVDCVWIIFMSHGQEGDSYEDSEIIGVDGMGYKTDDIVSRFYNDSCRAMIDKPKIFFFQACRGSLTDPGVTVGNVDSSFSERITTDGRRMRLSSRTVKVRTQSDIFIAYPAPKGIMANRDRVTGAWFIQTIVDVFSEHAWNTHLEDLLKMVDEKIKGVNNLHPLNFQAVTIKSIGWNKHLYFYPGLCRDKSTKKTIYIGTSQETSQSDVGMDVVDTSSTHSDKTLKGTFYSRLKDSKDEDSDDHKGKYDCFNISSCKTS